MRNSFSRVMVLTLTLLLLSTLWKMNFSNGQAETSVAIISGVLGCMDVNATNYDPAAVAQAYDQWENALCVYASCDDVPSVGCMYADAFAGWNDNFNAADCVNYGGTACVPGCLDVNATNFDADATVQSEDQFGNLLCVYTSCEDAPPDGCLYADSFGPYCDEFGHEACVSYGGMACGEYKVVILGGCIDPAATNYNAAATEQAVDEWNNQLCTYASCEDVPSTGCMYATSFAPYHSNFSATDCVNYGGTACVDASEGCMDANATNYDAAATVGAQDQWANSLCIYASCDDIPDAEGCMYGNAYSPFHETFNADNCVQYGGTACTEASATYGCLDFGAFILWIQYHLADLCNLGFLIALLLYMKTRVFAIEFTNDKKIIYTRLKQLLITYIFLVACIITFSVISNINKWDLINIGKINEMMLNLMFYVIIIFIARFSIFYHYGDFNEIEVDGYNKYTTTLDQEECQLIMTKITSIIEKDSVYFNPEYRLNDLANSCDISVHKVSQVINHIEGVSFSDFINRYRIEEAKKMLISEKYKTHTIIAIALEVGFNSKTAFYNAFKKLCDISPSAYIKQNKVD